MILNFEWDPVKANANIEKHKINFEEAATVLRDPNALTIFDPDHGQAEDRWLTIGISNSGRLLVVCHTFQYLDTSTVVIRIVSARKATKTESQHYGE